MDSRMGRTDTGHEKRVKEGGEEADDATRELKLSVLIIYFFYSQAFAHYIYFGQQHSCCFHMYVLWVLFSKFPWQEDWGQEFLAHPH